MAERAQRCSVCRSPRCLAIEHALNGGERLVNVARQFRISRHTLARHLRHQLRDVTPTRVADSWEDARKDPVLEKLYKIQVSLDVVERQAERFGDNRAKLATLKAKSSLLELEAKLKSPQEGGATTINFGIFGSLPGETVQAYQRRVYESTAEKLLSPQQDERNYRTYERTLRNFGIDEELTAKILELFGYRLPVAPVVFPGPPAALPAPQQEATNA